MDSSFDGRRAAIPGVRLRENVDVVKVQSFVFTAEQLGMDRGRWRRRSGRHSNVSSFVLEYRSRSSTASFFTRRFPYEIITADTARVLTERVWSTAGNVHRHPEQWRTGQRSGWHAQSGLSGDCHANVSPVPESVSPRATAAAAERSTATRPFMPSRCVTTWITVIVYIAINHTHGLYTTGQAEVVGFACFVLAFPRPPPVSATSTESGFLGRAISKTHSFLFFFHPVFRRFYRFVFKHVPSSPNKRTLRVRKIKLERTTRQCAV